MLDQNFYGLMHTSGSKFPQNILLQHAATTSRGATYDGGVAFVTHIKPKISKQLEIHSQSFERITAYLGKPTSTPPVMWLIPGADYSGPSLSRCFIRKTENSNV